MSLPFSGENETFSSNDWQQREEKWFQTCKHAVYLEDILRSKCGRIYLYLPLLAK